MKNPGNTFYAKIILFGEYGIIFDGMALTIPFAHMQGKFRFSDNYSFTNLDLARQSNGHLRKYCRHLQKNTELSELLNLDSFKNDLEKGLYFESTIPQGYGLGSSGAIVAAVYQRYSINKIKSHRTITSEEIFQLKSVFSNMEAFFHGKSSGIDPLNAYIKYPILFCNSQVVNVVSIPRNKEIKDSAIFLINTKQQGKTEPLVHLFVEKYKDDEQYKELIDQQFIPLTNLCVQNILNGDLSDFFKSLKSLSEFQLANMNPMIPYHIQDYWTHGIESDDYYLKLCGSGGGGYVLGFTQNFSKVKKYFKKHKIELISVYLND